MLFRVPLSKDALCDAITVRCYRPRGCWVVACASLPFMTGAWSLMEKSMQRVIAHIQTHLDWFIDQVAAAVVTADLDVYRDLPPAQIRVLAARAFAPFVDDLRAGSVAAYPTFWRQVGPQRAQAGVAIGDLLGLIDHSMVIMSASITATFADDPEATSWWFARMHAVSYAAATALAEAFVTAREQFIQAQTHELLALSTPIIPIADGILV